MGTSAAVFPCRVLLPVLMLMLMLMLVLSPVSAQNLIGSFQFLNYTWTSPVDYATWYNSNSFANGMLAGVKVNSRGDIFVSVPRWKPNVTATLNKLATKPGTLAPLLQPYPSWEGNAEGKPEALQSVLGFEIDSQDRLWVLDQGKVNGRPAIANSIKLQVFDTISNRMLWSYVFPPDVASLDNSFLNDIVVDEVHNFAYITDSGIPVNDTAQQPLGGIIAFDAHKKVAWRAISGTSAVNPDTSLSISINGNKVLPNKPMETGADGIALTPDCQWLYFCPLTSHILYRVPTSALRTGASVLASDVTVLGDKGVASDGLACDNAGHLYITSLEGSAILVGKANGSETSVVDMNFQPLVQNSSTMIWPDTIGFDHKGNILFVSNQLNSFVSNTMSFAAGQVNFRIWRVNVGADSYVDRKGANHRHGLSWLIVGVICGGAAVVVGGFWFLALYSRRGRDDYVGIA